MSLDDLSRNQHMVDVQKILMFFFSPSLCEQGVMQHMAWRKQELCLVSEADTCTPLTYELGVF